MNEDVIYFDDKVIVQTTVTNMCSVTRCWFTKQHKNVATAVFNLNSPKVAHYVCCF